MDELKKCTKCNKYKTLDNFSKEKRTKIGLQSRCKECINEQGKKYWYLYYEKNKKKKELYRINNREKIRISARKRYHSNIIENRKKKNESFKKNYIKNRDKILERAKVYSKNNREKIYIREKKWAINNPEKYKEKNRRNNLKRKLLIKTNPRIRISSRISNLIRLRLKARLGNKNKKHKKDYLPYTIDELMIHLEKLFQPGMSWNNYGKWHIDHKIPDSSFDYKSVDDIDFKKCWSLENLQPLWAIDNQRKSNKIVI